MTATIHPSRRRFLQVAGLTAISAPFHARAAGANDTVRIGIIGCGGRGTSLASQFFGTRGVAIAAISDPDTVQMDRLVDKMGKKDKDISRAAKFQDYRKLLEQQDIDAVVIASPNHWHTLHAIHAMQAGKDAYLEKPVTYNLWEGRQLLAAEESTGQIIAAGFQNRSDRGIKNGFQFVHEGGLGRIKRVHVCCFRNRQSIGKQSQRLTPPTTCDYNLWLGPAADIPMYRPKFHYDWHWIFNTGNGDMGNQCPHEIDIAQWVLGDKPLPTRIQSFGGRFGWNDAGDTPNMISAWYELDGTPCIIELNDMHITPDRNAAGMRDQIRVGIVVHCEGGQLRGGRGGMYAVGEDGKTKIEKFPGDAGGKHAENFIDAIRSRRKEDIASKLAAAERSSSLAHLANASYLSGAIADGPTLGAAIGDNEVLRQITIDQARQLDAWGIKSPKYRLGRPLDVDPKESVITTPGIDPTLSRREPRGEFTVPEMA